jgi:hypothetical protein
MPSPLAAQVPVVSARQGSASSPHRYHHDDDGQLEVARTDIFTVAG